MAEGLHASIWDGRRRRAAAPAEVARAARIYMTAQVEAGHICPITMTSASVGALAASPALREWLAAEDPVAATTTRASGRGGRRPAITLGMGMTEKQGGTDVRANLTRAVATAASGYASPATNGSCRRRCATPSWCWRRRRAGLTCFLMPRFLPDGSVNALRFQRLKDKLGNRSNASSEVEFAEAVCLARRRARAGACATIIEMVTLTRLDCAIGSAGLMRMALAEAVHHARHRSVFQRQLVDQPLMRRGAGRHGAGRTRRSRAVVPAGRSFDRAAADPREAALRAADDAGGEILGVQDRAAASSTRRWSASAATATSRKAALARLYREAPVNAIWEGSGNVMASTCCACSAARAKRRAT